MRFALLIAIIAGCPRKIPDHLRLDPPEGSDAAEQPITDVTEALATMLGADPLARSPELLEPALLADLDPGGMALASYVDQVRALERGEGQVERALQQLEDEWRSSAVVALSRGYRLRIAENHLANSLNGQEQIEDRIVTLITPLAAGPTQETLPRTALEWLIREERLESVVRAYTDRWVLLGWMADPGIPTGVLAPILDAPQYDELRQTPSGKLVFARARRDQADTAEAWADLERATALALQGAAADRDKEQAAWAEVRRAEAEVLASDDPIDALLARAAEGLTAGAGDDRASGGALLALAARRWSGDCTEAPCHGIDRIETVQFAESWHPDVARLAATWRVIALKNALDTLDAGHDTALFPDGMVDLVDALLGTGGGPLDVQLLRKRRPDATVWLEVSRAIGTEGVTDWSGAKAALGTHLGAEAARAEELWSDQEILALLERIRKRSIP